MSAELSPRLAALLPAASVTKYERLLGDVLAAASAVRAASLVEEELQDRIRAIRNGKTMSKSSETERLAAIAGLKAKLVKAREATARASVPFNQGATVLDELRTLLSDRRRHGAPAFEAHPIAPIFSQTPMIDIDEVRSQITAIDAETSRVDQAPIPAADIKRRIADLVDEFAGGGKPTIRPRARDGVPANLPSLFSNHSFHEKITPEAGTGFFVWLLRDLIVDRMNELVDATPTPDALSDDDRARLLVTLAARRFEAERKEEALILGAEGQGVVIARRRDANPFVVFELQRA